MSHLAASDIILWRLKLLRRRATRLCQFRSRWKLVYCKSGIYLMHSGSKMYVLVEQLCAWPPLPVLTGSSAQSKLLPFSAHEKMCFDIFTTLDFFYFYFLCLENYLVPKIRQKWYKKHCFGTILKCEPIFQCAEKREVIDRWCRQCVHMFYATREPQGGYLPISKSLIKPR